MTAAASTQPGFASRMVNGVLAIKPLANFAKHQARQMMIKRAEKIGVPWRKQAQELAERNWDEEFARVCNPELKYPEYYLCSFHAYDRGNLSWEAATEVEVAARAVHATIWPSAGAQGDAKLRNSYHQVLKERVPEAPRDIVDLGCSVGMSTFALQEVYPEANCTGVDLSPYFLAVAQYRSQQRHRDIPWVHAPAESTGLPENSFDLVSACLMFHELPQEASRQIFREARRLLRPGGHLAIMDMNPKSEVYAKMPPYVLTLLKSTEPYLDCYFGLDMAKEIAAAGFQTPAIAATTPRHRAIVARVK
ncbi:class I SAM-dependent methyltransferase [Phormidium sp. CCY1219]|uniref:class I SAM-dependent methyltransferase n=1 Tax=Phormidium sp. CCY1219 TaxID=2886104 RepID=UPI002D1E7DD5|nr:class I SAM-dependent methyltransferase [Phormidium sp. CCY1219]MEB3831582.1 class I SAM-dependent methyltransferase [Phormidium sp. CCY1219]